MRNESAAAWIGHARTLRKGDAKDHPRRTMWASRSNGPSQNRIWPALVFTALSLTGCAHNQYVQTYCATPEQYQQLKAAEPPKVGSKLTGQAQDDLKTIAGSNVELRSWGEGLLGVIGGCSGK